jgi:AcrB/AcrD/AcrF family
LHLNVSAVVGFISLFGVAVMSGVLYVAEVRRRRADAGGDLREVTREAAAVQFRPMLLLIVVAMLGCCRRRSRAASARTSSGRWRRWSSAALPRRCS